MTNTTTPGSQMVLMVQITDMVHDMADYTGGWVLISRIIPKLQADRADIVAAFTKLLALDVLALAPESNTKVLTDADKAHALRLGSEDLHLACLQG